MVKHSQTRPIVLQDALIEMSSSLLDASPNDIDSAIDNALNILGKLLNCERTYIFHYDLKHKTTSNTHEWCAENITPEMQNLQNIPIKTLTGWYDIHAKGESVFIPDVPNMPDGTVKNLLLSQKIKTILTVPMMTQNGCKGFVGFDSVTTHRNYHPDESKLLKTFANILWSVTERIRYQNKLERSQHMLRTVLDTINVRVFWKDTNLNYLGVNKMFAQDADLDDPDDLIGKSDYDLTWIEQADLYTNDDKAVLKKQKAKINYEEPQTTPDGKTIWLRTSKYPLKTPKGELIGVLGTYEDITEKKHLELKVFKTQEKLKNENLRFNQLVNSTDDIIFELDPNLKHRAVYGKWLKKNNLNSKIFLGKTFTEILGEAQAKVHEKHAKIALGFESTTYEWSSQINGEERHYQTSLSPIIHQNKVTGIVGIGRDITDKVHYLETIEYLSFHDYLTGLYNRRFFEEELKRLNTKRNYPFGVMILDVNGLKLLNDAFGHKAGDEALIAIAEAIKKTCREDDIIARIGGDEYGIILPNTSSPACDKIRLRLNDAIKTIKIANVDVTASIGYSVKVSDKKDIGILMKDAEDIMYKRKSIEGKSLRSKSIQSILKALTDKYIEEHVHSERVGKISVRIGQAMGLNQDTLDELYLAGTLHDIGKITMPDSILNKPSKLTKAEREIIKKHTINGYQILRSADEYSNLAEYALSHHEWYNGQGYPNKLRGKAIPLISRILAVADAYEVMTSDRSYRKAPGRDYAVEELKKFSGTQFDPNVVEALLSSIDKEE